MNSEIKYNVNVIVNSNDKEINEIVKIFNKKLAKVIIKENSSQV